MGRPFNKYDQFAEDVGRAKHQLNSNVLKLALTDRAPDPTNDKLLADVVELAAGNGYPAGGTAVPSTSYAQVAGVGKLAGSDVPFAASGGDLGPFRYVVLYNATAAGGPVIGWWDRGSELTLEDGDTFTQDFTDNADIIQLT